MKKQYSDVIVIGGGLSGLSAAAYLSRQGLRVRLVERLNQLGGCVHTFRRKDYLFEASTHQILCCNQPSYGRKVFRMLGIEKVRPVKSDILCETIHFDPATFSIRERYQLPSGFDAARRRLIDYFPEVKDEINRAFSILRKIGTEALALKNVGRNPKEALADAVMALMLKNGKGFVKDIGKMRYRSVARHAACTYRDATNFITNENLRWILSEYGGYLGGSPDELNAFIMGSLIYMYMHDGPYLFSGGTGTLIDELEDIIRLNGGTIHKKSPVGRIVVSPEKKAEGVETVDGTLYRADALISAINTSDTIDKLVPEHAVSKEYRERLQKVKPTTSTFQIYLGLKKSPREYGIVAPTTFFDSTKDGAERHCQWLRASTPESRDATSFIFSNYEDAGLNPPALGKVSASIVECMEMDDWNTLDAHEYTEKKDKTTRTILDKFQRVTGIPVDETAEVIVSGTPRTIHAYTGAPGGAFVGAAYDSSQVLAKRTEPITPIDNLFLAGSYVSYGGVMSCLDSGIVTSKLVVKHLSSKRGKREKGREKMEGGG